ncbi:MAG: LptF/LptG family permease [Candidatus Omnitrophica bacterium]|nr:LptF/LptG family permease [Candidatus Omnitrophota bacterium]MDD5487550.1 LptF/LptG family permease [Candidatus Omnitrophota bacterium]
MRIITRYTLRELGGPFIASLFISTVILAAGNIVQTVDMVMNKGVEASQVARVFLYFLPYVLIFTIPISVLSAVLLGFGRLSGDNEITTLRTSGVNLYKVVIPVVICGFIISLMSMPLNDKMLPQAEFEARKLLKTIGIKHPTAMLEPGVFVKGFQDYIIFIHEVEGDTLRNIRIYQPQKDKPTRTIIAKRGKVISMPEQGSVKLWLSDGTADEISANNPDEFYKISFKDYYMTLNLGDVTDPDDIQKKSREKSIKELKDEINTLERDSIDVIPLRIEMHKKIALAFSNLVFVIVGMPLAITTHRREKFIGFGLAIGLFLVYWSIMLSGIALAIRGIIPPWAGVWSSDIILASLGIVLFYKISTR